MYGNDRKHKQENKKNKLKLLEKIAGILESLSKVNEKRYVIDFKKESRLSREALFEKLNEISVFLKDCSEQNIAVDTSELNNIHFRPYSLTKLDEDVRKYIDVVKKYQNRDNLEESMNLLLEERNEIVDSVPKFLSPYFDYLFPTLLVLESNDYSYSTVCTGGPVKDLENNPLMEKTHIDRLEPMEYASVKIVYTGYRYSEQEFEFKKDIEQIKSNTQMHNSNALIFNPYDLISVPVNFIGSFYIPYERTDLKHRIIKACNGDEKKAEEIYSEYKEKFGRLGFRERNVFQEHVDYMKNHKEDFLNVSVIKNFETRYLDYLIDSYDAYATALVNMKQQVLDKKTVKSLEISPCEKN